MTQDTEDAGDCQLSPGPRRPVLRASARSGGRPLQTRSKDAMRLAVYQPDIAQNTAALMRLGACLGVAIDLIEPFGFVFDDRRLRRVAMDYLDLARVRR